MDATIRPRLQHTSLDQLFPVISSSIQPQLEHFSLPLKPVNYNVLYLPTSAVPSKVVFVVCNCALKCADSADYPLAGAKSMEQLIYLSSRRCLIRSFPGKVCSELAQKISHGSQIDFGQHQSFHPLLRSTNPGKGPRGCNRNI